MDRLRPWQKRVLLLLLMVVVEVVDGTTASKGHDLNCA